VGEQDILFGKMKNHTEAGRRVQTSNVKDIVLWGIKSPDLMVVASLSWRPADDKSFSSQDIFQLGPQPSEPSARIGIFPWTANKLVHFR
jgi:hypothetical protein